LIYLFFSQPNPTYTFPGDASLPPRDILPNPGENPELVAVMRTHGQGMGNEVDILDVRDARHIAGWRRGDDPNVSPVCSKSAAINLLSNLIFPQSAGRPEESKLRLVFSLGIYFYIIH
jgi:hypothetical protein